MQESASMHKRPIPVKHLRMNPARSKEERKAFPIAACLRRGKDPHQWESNSAFFATPDAHLSPSSSCPFLTLFFLNGSPLLQLGSAPSTLPLLFFNYLLFSLLFRAVLLRNSYCPLCSSAPMSTHTPGPSQHPIPDYLATFATLPKHSPCCPHPLHPLVPPPSCHLLSSLN